MTKAKTTKTNNDTDSPIQVLKTGTCPTTSGKSTLGYKVGLDESGAIHLRIASNDGGGMFSSEWVSFPDIQEAIKQWPEEQGLTSMTFHKIFRGKSANTPGFLVAVLCAEGIIKPMEDKKRVHQACDPKPFLANVEALQGGSPKQPKTKAKAKAAPKKKAASKAKSKSPAKASAKTAKTPRKTK